MSGCLSAGWSGSRGVGPGVGVGRVRDGVRFGRGLRAKGRSGRFGLRFGRFGFRVGLRRVVQLLELLFLPFF